jgi:hypothetical protein
LHETFSHKIEAEIDSETELSLEKGKMFSPFLQESIAGGGST